MKSKYILWTLGLVLCLGIVSSRPSNITDLPPPEKVMEYTSLEYIPDTFSEHNLKIALVMANIQHWEIVYKQAKLETGNFTSYSFRKRNNLFGFYNGKRYLTFAS